jgi:hypothetical protein
MMKGIFSCVSQGFLWGKRSQCRVWPLLCEESGKLGSSAGVDFLPLAGLDSAT